MNKIITDVAMGTTSMVTIAMCIMVIVFVFMIFQDHKFIDARKLYKDWILFTGISMTLTSLIFDAFVPSLFSNNGFFPEQIRLLMIYNNFVRIVGVCFVLIWAIVFQAFIVGHNIDIWMHRKKSKEIK